MPLTATGRKTILIVTILGMAALIAGAALRFALVRPPQPPKLSVNERFIPQFRLLTLEDPLFWSRSLDQDELENAVQNLKRIGEAADALVKRAGMRNEPGLYWPLPFLETIPRVGKATQKFLSDPSTENVLRLIKEYESAVETYEKEVGKLAKAADQYFATAENDITLNLPLFGQNIAELKREIEKRKNCLSSGQCDIRLNMPPAFEPPSAFPPRLPKELLFPNLSELSIKGPVRIRSTCWGSPEWREMYLVEGPRGRQRLKLADENFYLVVPERRKLDELVADGALIPPVAELYSKHLEANLPLLFINDVTFRRCQDLTHHPQAYTLIWLKETLNSSAGTTQGIKIEKTDESVKALLNQLNAAEQALKTSDTPSWDQATKFADALRKVIELYNQNRLRLDKTALERLSLIQSSITSGLPMFDKVLNNLGADIENATLWFWENDRVPDAVHRISSNSYISITLLPFSRAVWRINENPRYTHQMSMSNKNLEELELQSIADLQKNIDSPYGYKLLSVSQLRNLGLFDIQELIRITQESFRISLEVSD